VSEDEIDSHARKDVIERAKEYAARSRSKPEIKRFHHPEGERL
jgi:hypothetical protein